MKRSILVASAVSVGLAALALALRAQSPDLIFSHKFHMETVEAECSDCHAAEGSKLSSDNLLPDMDACYGCHDEEEKCTKCHRDPDNAVEFPRIVDYIAEFPHDRHIAGGIACERCHGDVAAARDVTGTHLPEMSVCSGCHLPTQAGDFCYTCHAEGGNLKPADHGPAWRARHGIEAETAEVSCGSCHTKESCLNCHEGENLDRNVHPLGFAVNHPLYARGNKENCYTCHEEQSFCIDCHEAKMVIPRTHASAGWSNATTGGSHKMAAKLDLDSCLSCHSDAEGDPVCAACHRK